MQASRADAIAREPARSWLRAQRYGRRAGRFLGDPPSRSPPVSKSGLKARSPAPIALIGLSCFGSFDLTIRATRIAMWVLGCEAIFRIRLDAAAVHGFGRLRVETNMLVAVTPDENEIVGEWVLDGTRLQKNVAAERIEHLTSEVFEKIAVSKEAGGWETLFRDPADGRLWERTFPKGHMHGGGPPRLAVISAETAKRKYSIP